MIRFDLVNLCNFTKVQFKRRVKEVVSDLNRKKLIERVKSAHYKKINLIRFENDNHEKKPYFSNLSVADGRLKFKIVSCMTPKVKMNFRSNKAFSKSLWKCENCTSEKDIGFRDSQSHLILCPAFAKFREGKDLAKDKDLVDFFKAVIEQRSG